MATIIWQQKLPGFATYLQTIDEATAKHYRRVYEQNRHRVYSLAFWMTDSELEAEDILENTFCRAFSSDTNPQSEDIDLALVAELRDRMPLGEMTLECTPSEHVESVRKNTMRIHMERAVVQLPTTERLVFLMHDVERCDVPRIVRTLQLTDAEVRNALHQARLKMRELLAEMKH